MRELLIDTDVLIWYLRGHAAAGVLLDGLAEPFLSAVTYMGKPWPVPVSLLCGEQDSGDHVIACRAASADIPKRRTDR